MRFGLSDNLNVLLLITEKDCYVFTPEETDSLSQRPSKRRKTEPGKAPTEQVAEFPFAPLLKGLEKLESGRIRAEIFEFAWRPKETLLKVYSFHSDVENVGALIETSETMTTPVLRRSRR